MSVMPIAEAHGNEPPAVVAEGMLAADIVFAITDKALTHSSARQASINAGTRTYILRGVTTEMMIEGAIDTDYEELTRVTEAYSDRLSATAHAHVTSPAGTDVHIDLTGKGSYVLDGRFYDDGRAAAAIPTGEAPIGPVEGSAEGTIVIDYSMDNIGALETPIELTFVDGVVTAISGGEEADRLREIVQGADPNARNLAEFAIGTNPDARLIGNLAEDKKKAGTVHFAIGDNRGLDGTVESDIHLDGLVTSPTVTLDSEEIVIDGELQIDYLLDEG
jgi:leucyl aminopeptidase (aminopeptidase T)